MVQRVAVQLGVHAAGIEQRTHRGGEPQPAGHRRQVQRLDAQPVARQRHHTGVPVGDGEREHPLESVDAAHAPVVERLDHHLAVGGREEAVPGGLKFVAQLLVVVDAAVEHQRQPEIAVDHRLGAAGGQVDDRQPPMPERHWSVGHHAVGIRSARRHRAGHPGDCADIRCAPVPADLTADTAHVSCFRFLGVWPTNLQPVLGAARIHVSLLPPPKDELTIRDPRLATRVNAAGVTCADTEPPAPALRWTNARRST